MATDPRLIFLKDTLFQLQESGVQRIGVAALIDSLAKLETVDVEASPQVSAGELELYKAKLAVWVEQHKAQANIDAEGFKSVILAGQSALRSSILLNGGAAVAILAHIGGLGDPSRVAGFAFPLLLFVGGALTIAFGSGVTYLSQWFYFGGSRRKWKVGFALNILAILLGLASYGLFAAGAWLAYLAFKAGAA